MQSWNLWNWQVLSFPLLPLNKPSAQWKRLHLASFIISQISCASPGSQPNQVDFSSILKKYSNRLWDPGYGILTFLILQSLPPIFPGCLIYSQVQLLCGPSWHVMFSSPGCEYMRLTNCYYLVNNLICLLLSHVILFWMGYTSFTNRDAILWFITNIFRLSDDQYTFVIHLVFPHSSWLTALQTLGIPQAVRAMEMPFAIILGLLSAVPKMASEPWRWNVYHVVHNLFISTTNGVMLLRWLGKQLKLGAGH